ncbi:hypothetical protein AB0L63_30200 [Nocardia sp. NPDC051990]|uniref:hypothetical protein n=1 Tax=Nocardia sp. NPDC051990 TaxID=3155285 RepID=UPI00341625F8
MNYSDDMEQIVEEIRRRSTMLLDEFEEINRRTADKDRELAEQSAIGMRQFWEDHAEELAAAKAEAEEKERLEVEARAERERLAAEAREQREAIARSIAARKAHDVVAPIDDEGDEESEYYRRKSWLI